METPTSFGLWLQARRQALGLTQQELADRIHCSRSLIRKIEADERRPSYEIAELLAEHLQILIEERALFLRVARQELRVDQLAMVTAAPVHAWPTLSELAAKAPGQVLPTMSTQVPQPRLSNLPLPTTTLVGRTTELATLSQLLHDPACRLLTLVGLGGIGKTRLALAAAAHDQILFPDGVYFVSLAAINTGQLLLPTLAGALDLPLQGTGEAKQQLLNHLRHRCLLLVLDSAEHLLGEMTLAVDILQQAPAVKLLVTSLERLNLHDEWVFDVQGLPIPRDGPVDQPGNEQASAVQLFVERARRLLPGFDSTANRSAILYICQLTEGIPLAIELAAAWVHLLSCQEIAQEIEHNLDFLAAARRDLPARQHSLRAAFDHAWRLLAPAEQTLLQQFSVFRGGFTREAAQAVGATLPQLAALVDKSLLRRTADGRYSLHEVVRQYSGSLLAELGAVAETQAKMKHLDFYLQLALNFEAQFLASQMAAWFERMEQELANLRVALTFAFATALEKALRLIIALCDYWFNRSVFEGREWMLRALARAETQRSAIDPKVYTHLLLKATHLIDDRSHNVELARNALTQAEALADAALIAEAQRSIAANIWQAGHMAEAASLFEESIRRFTQLGAQSELYDTLSLYSVALRYRGMYAQANLFCQRSLQTARETNSPLLTAHALGLLGFTLFCTGDFAQAHALLQESVTGFERNGSKRGHAAMLRTLGQIAAYQGQWALSQTCLQRSIDLFDDLALPRQITLNQLCLVEQAYLAGNVTEARSWLAQAEQVSTAPPYLQVFRLLQTGNLARLEGDFAHASSLLTASLHRATSASDYWTQLAIIRAQGLLALTQQDLPAAEDAFTRSFAAAQTCGDRYTLTCSLEGLAGVAVHREQFALSGERFQQAAALRTACAAPMSPMEQQVYGPLIGKASI